MAYFFNTIQQNIKHWNFNSFDALQVHGLTHHHWTFLFSNFLKESLFSDKNHILIFPTVEKTEEVYANLKNQDFGENIEVLNLPGLEVSPYSGFIASERNLYERFYALNHLVHKKNKRFICLCSIESFLFKNPPPSFFKGSHLKLEVSDIISPFELSQKLVELGYVSSTTVEEPGTFAHKGEIFDVYPMSGEAVRFHYFDDMIEEIFKIDLDSYKTLRDQPYSETILTAAPGVLINQNYSNQLRESIPMPATQYKEKFEKRKLMFSQISEGHLFENYPAFIPLFFKECFPLTEFFKKDQTLIHFFDHFQVKQEILDFLETSRGEYQRVLDDPQSDVLIPEPEKLYFEDFDQIVEEFPKLEINDVAISYDFEESTKNKLDIQFENARVFLTHETSSSVTNRPEFIRSSLELIKKKFINQGQVIFLYQTEASLRELRYLCELNEVDIKLKERLSFIRYPLNEGFYYSTENILVVSEADFFSNKKAKAKKNTKQNVDLFAEQLATLKENDFVIHSDHGVGQYLGLETIEAGGISTDYLVLQYSGKDKVYVPVYKMNLIQKHADAHAPISIDSLRTNKFSQAKKKARESAKKLAFDFLKLQAERESSKAFSFSPPDHEFKEFELSFPFQETPDQTSAIDDVIESMQKDRPMDHLVCGDVGFGKTEVAMRASYKAVLDHKQVAILVPTTILALQHFNSFKKRFKDSAVNIEFLSRFKSTKESNQIIDKLKFGEVDILIGTHKLLSDKIKFKDLGLVVVDEEQRFGVGHKEKLKLLRANVDFLTLTATPIPRTLQMAFLGLRNLSLIKTAPPKRQSIKTYIIKEDDYTLQKAIEKELLRGGQVFIVHNRVQDIDEYSSYIRELVPNASIVVGHGQLPEKELEKRINSFYQGEHQILIATTIIESGLDIPNANTMIVDRADRYGLSQLHQLRGRIGRSDKKAYAYFVIPKGRHLSTVAEKRLKALQTYADMGSGFNIASCDLEIRGAGDLLGANQSGHIEAIGLELYMELLQDAIRELKGEKKLFNKNIEFNTSFTSYIPDNYISDSSERLKQYKRLSNCSDIDSLESFKDEFFDVYGAHPKELQHLFIVLESRIWLQHCGVSSVSLSGSNITLQFDKSILNDNQELAGRVAQTFLGHPKLYQFSPDYKVLYKSKTAFTPESLLKFCQETSQKITPK